MYFDFHYIKTIINKIQTFLIIDQYGIISTVCKISKTKQCHTVDEKPVPKMYMELGAWKCACWGVECVQLRYDAAHFTHAALVPCCAQQGRLGCTARTFAVPKLAPRLVRRVEKSIPCKTFYHTLHNSWGVLQCTTRSVRRPQRPWGESQSTEAGPRVLRRAPE